MKPSLNILERLALKRMVVADVLQVYSGKPGKCCCGCAGNHRYNSAYVAEASAYRGYEVSADEVNDRQVAKVLALLQANPDLVEASDNNVSAEINGRLYVAYLREEK